LLLPGTTLGYLAPKEDKKKKEEQQPELPAAEEADVPATVVVTPAAA
jgi:hypothetical protein